MVATTGQVKKVPNPTGRGGFGDNPQNINKGGEPKNSLKNYVARMFSEMTDEQKLKWLKENKISGIDQWKMGEGQPKQDTELKGKLTISQVLDDLENGSASEEQGVENQ